MDRRDILKKGLSLLGVTLSSQLDLGAGILKAVARDQQLPSGVDWPDDKSAVERIIRAEGERSTTLLAFKDPCKEQFNKKEFMDKFDGC